MQPLAEDTEATCRQPTQGEYECFTTAHEHPFLVLVNPPCFSSLDVGNILVQRDAVQRFVIFFYPVVLNCHSLNLFISILHPRKHYDGPVPVMYYCT
jgi:hypothetical protein